MTLPETRRAEIVALVDGIKADTASLRKHRIDATDPRDLLDAFDILNRIECRILAATPANHPTREAAE